jgi:hypothetical protein
MQIFFVMALSLIALRSSESIRFIEPNSTIPFIDDIPLWLRIEFENRNEECFSVFIDKKYALATCEENTLIESKLLPGNHSLELYPSNLPTSESNVFRHEFQVLEPSDRLPAHLSKDGWSLSLPPFVDEYHKFWYDAGIWYVDDVKVDRFFLCVDGADGGRRNSQEF